MSQEEKAKYETLTKKRVVKFATISEEGKGVKTLHITRTPFSYIGSDKYVITKKQCVILKEAGVGYKVVKYLP